MHEQELLRGKRRGDSQEFAGISIGSGGDFNRNGHDIIVAEAKRRCLEPTPFAEWQSTLNARSNGYHPVNQEETFLPVSDLPAGATNDMDVSSEQSNSAAMMSNGHVNGFGHNCQDNNFHHHQRGQQTDIKGGGEPASPVILNGYYGFIAHYDPAGGDMKDDAMETELHVEAEYAINGPSSCIEPKERRVCMRCKAGEPGHITHIMCSC